MITLKTELQRIRGLSPSFLSKLGKLGILSVRDLLFHFPVRYEDFSRIIPIADLEMRQTATVEGIVKAVSSRKSWRRNIVVVEAMISDESGAVRAVWFNQPYLAKILRPGLRVNFAGKVASGPDGIYLSNPSYEPVRNDGVLRHTAGLIPVYPETRGLTSRGIRYLVRPILEILPPLEEFIPPRILSENKFPSIQAALRAIHFPKTIEEADLARKRFAFEDIFLLHLMNAKFRATLSRESAPEIVPAPDTVASILATLPFELTSSQKRSLSEIMDDMGRGKPMNRFLQGDVGSGKTVVAATAAIGAAEQGYQAAFAAPTEVLARQHYETFQKFFSDFLLSHDISINLLTAHTKKKEKEEIAGRIKEGKPRIVIGTHALLQDTIVFPRLGLVVIDEQHRFGVKQRAKLVAQGKSSEAKHASLLPHFLSMSATPIPRTLSLTVFGDLDLSIIDELPSGRKDIITKIVAPEKRVKAYEFIREQIKNGRQGFVICPRIEPSKETDGQSETPAPRATAHNPPWSETKTVKEEYEKLSKKIFPDLTIGMLHGKMKAREKEAVMNEFKTGKTDILVSTSVIEVGVDVPNATIMIIEGAEHFGLAQLYQFRGRIGRGEHQSYCLLFTESGSESVEHRLNALMKAKNGFEVAEHDLAIRGPGEFLGEKQTGLPDLAMQSLTDMELVRQSRESARTIITEDPGLKNYPALLERLKDFERKIHPE
jgi:ATP-dependent DNA helicase RecG